VLGQTGGKVKDSVKKAGLFVDGFNLYHAVKELGDEYLKWADLWRIGAEIIPSRTETLEMVEFCTAYYPGDHGKRIRHDAYKQALEIKGVRCHWGHYADDHRECPACQHRWVRPAEKQSDINVALSVFDAARRGRIDHAYLLSADGDQAATVKWFREAFPEKDITLVIPPVRPGSKIIRDRGGRKKIQLTREHFERAHLGPVVTNGGRSVIRPFEYDPPAGWVHPDEIALRKVPKPPPKGAWRNAGKG